MPPPGSPADDADVAPREPPAFSWEELRHCPLVPVALAVTAGAVADRWAGVGLGAWAGLALVALGLGVARWRMMGRVHLPALMALCVALGGGYHHQYRWLYPDDDIGRVCAEGAVGGRLRGVLEADPSASRPEADRLWYAFETGERTRLALRVTAWRGGSDWHPASGRVRAYVSGAWAGGRAGDAVECVGTLRPPEAATNPGQPDRRAALADGRVTAEFAVERPEDAMTLPESEAGLAGELARAREFARRVLAESLPESTRGLAEALLLGDTSALPPAAWDSYSRTGVIHVLAISGQHLIILALLLDGLLRLARCRPRRRAWLVGGTVVLYALLTGGRPAALRAAAVVALAGAGLLMRAPGRPANAFAAAWLCVFLLQPTDTFTPGCQLSFLATATLIGAVPRLLSGREELTAAEQLWRETDPVVVRWARAAWEVVRTAYVVNAAIFAAVAPLTAYWSNLFSPVALLLGPPLGLLSTLALASGFLLVLTGGALGPLSDVSAWATHLSLSGCATLVGRGEGLPAAWAYVPTPPGGFVLGLLSAVVAFLSWPVSRPLRAFAAARGVPVALAAGAALAVWLGSTFVGRPGGRNELRVTALAVGHGGAALVECPDGRALLIDAGAMRGPEVARAAVAPLLWARGRSRLDAVFLSHADLDHFNALPPLLERFRVGRAYLSPTFTRKESPPARALLALLERHRIPVERLSAGDRLGFGEVAVTVRHPPEGGVPGDENANSLVLELVHRERRVLLTGDLSGAGLESALSVPIDPVDALLVPHHGSNASNTPELVSWARPQLAVSSQGASRSRRETGEAYRAAGVPFWRTDQRGAVEITIGPGGMAARAFLTGEVMAIGKRTPGGRRR